MPTDGRWDLIRRLKGWGKIPPIKTSVTVILLHFPLRGPKENV